MIAAAHLDNWLFILLVAVAMLFRWLTKVASKASKNSGNADERSTSAPPPIPRAPAPSDEERIRKFLEALGQPAGSSPPPPIAQRPTYQKPIVLPRMPPFGSPLPPLTTKPPELPRKITLPGQITQPPYEKKTFKPKAAEASFEVHQATATAPSAPPPPINSPAEAYAAATSPTAAPARSETNIAALLRSPSGLRNAIILREVFGPPRSLQPLSEPDWRM
jgi:hypothetical protein